MDSLWVLALGQGLPCGLSASTLGNTYILPGCASAIGKQCPVILVSSRNQPSVTLWSNIREPPGVSLRRKLLIHNLVGASDYKSPFKQLKPPSIYYADSYRQLSVLFLVFFVFSSCNSTPWKEWKRPHNINNKILRKWHYVHKYCINFRVMTNLPGRGKKKKQLTSSVNNDNIENFAFNGGYTYVM
jgi:hypothetical protein